MSIPLTAPQVLGREFLEIRCKILEVAASLDRLERADGTVDDDARLHKIHEALKILSNSTGSDRAEQVQLLFSRTYDEKWPAQFGIKPR